MVGLKLQCGSQGGWRGDSVEQRVLGTRLASGALDVNDHHCPEGRKGG